MKMAREYTLLINTERHLSDTELRDLERLVDDEIHCESWTTFHNDEPTIIENTRVGVEFGTPYDPQKMVRVAVRLALKQIVEVHENDLNANAIGDFSELRLLLPKAGEAWDCATLAEVEDLLAAASDKMGDHAFWNSGGQGHRALRLLRKELGL